MTHNLKFTYKIKHLSKILMLGIVLVINACQKDYSPLVSLGIDDVYLMPRMKTLAINPEYTGNNYRWTLRTSKGEDSLISTERNYIFLFQQTGTYHATFEIIDDENPYKHNIKIVVIEEQVSYSPYIHKVYEYHPAPGQFINDLPKYEDGDSYEDMLKKVENCLARNNQQMISLGAYGGYVTFGFDHTVINVPNEYDFKIEGNAFVAATHINSDHKGGSCEPGIIMVAFDKNQNGRPDSNEWYELAGSEYYKPSTKKNYQITYRRHDPNSPPVPDPDNSITNLTYIPWTDNYDSTGYVHKNKYHHQSYWPLWIPENINTLTFEGTKLANNAIDESGDGSYFVQYMLPWGYVDNQPNKDELGYKIDWAIDKKGNPVYLSGVDFIRVYTGLNQYCGWLGETSTEIISARDLHIYEKPFNH